MKAAYGVLIGLSMAFCGFSVAFGIKALNQRSSYRPGARDGGFERFERARDRLHNIERGVSIPFFLACLATFISGAIAARGRKGRRIAAIVGSVLAGVMIVLSLILSGGASFAEVFGVWVASSVVFAGLAVFGLISEFGRSNGPLRPLLLDKNARVPRESAGGRSPRFDARFSHNPG